MRCARLVLPLVLATSAAHAAPIPFSSPSTPPSSASAPAGQAGAAPPASAAAGTAPSAAGAPAADAPIAAGPASTLAITPPAVAAPPTATLASDEATIGSDVAPPAVSAPAARHPRSIPLKSFPHSREGKPLRWDPEWRRFELGDYVLTGTDGALALAAAIVKPISPVWNQPILFDRAARNTLRLGSLDARGWAGDTSDVLLSAQIMAPFLIDSLATAWWYRGSADVAQEMALIDLETLSVTAALQGISVTLTSRQRPYVQTCGSTLPANSAECQTNSQDRSFFSGHTSMSFTSAALVCSHHLNLDLFENGPADEVSCASALGVAATTGVLRIMSDNHYASDVLTGFVVGNAVGFGMPYLLHYRRHKKLAAGAPPSLERHDFNFQLVPMGLGAGAVGTF